MSEEKQVKRWQDKLGEKAYVLSFTGYPKRKKLMQDELARVDLTADFIWGFPTPLQSILLKYSDMPHSSALDNPSYIGNWFSHYRIAKTGYEMGYNRILIMEDDCRFLSDLDEMARWMEDFPEDADMVMLDYGMKDRNKYLQFCRNSDSEHWIRTDGNTRITSAACYSLNRNGMKAYIRIFEKTFRKEDGLCALNVDSYWTNEYILKYGANSICLPKKNLAIQTTIEDVEHGFYERYVLHKYALAGITQTRYGYGKVK